MALSFHYEYSDKMYEQYGKKPPHFVEAKYVEAKNSCMHGNMFYEALPVLRPYDSRDYIVRLPFTPSKAGEADEETRLEEVIAIDDIRVPLAFQEDVLRGFKTVLYRACRERIKMAIEKCAPLVVSDKLLQQGLSFSQSTEGDVGNGFCFVGFPGSTKTTTIDNVLSMFPKVIIHKMEGVGISTQVPIVRVNCDPNDNLSKLYENIGVRLDDLLGNSTEHYCEKMVHRETTVVGKANAVANLLIAYNVLVLILDEVQELDFKKNQSTSFHSLVSIVNKVKCGLISIGTQDTLERVYSEWYAGDRAGNNIDTSSYCLDKKLISDILRALFVTQWFDEKVELTDDIVNAFFECTGGSMRKIKALYIEATQKYIIARKKKHITVDGNFFREVALQRWAKLGIIIKHNRDEYVRLNERLKKAASAKQEKEINDAIRHLEYQYAEQVAGFNKDSEIETLISKVSEHLMIENKPINRADLESICIDVYAKYSDKNDMVSLVRKVLSRCKSIKPPKKVKDMYQETELVTDLKNRILNGND